MDSAKVRIDSFLQPGTVAESTAQLDDAATVGFDGLWTAELAGDPFLPLALAAARTHDADLGTAITIAFARSPMTLAYTAVDLQRLSGGRFVLGLGSQVRAHVERRFSMPWSHPARRMREYVLALRAIWTAWARGSPLDFEGEFYRHTLMTPLFTPDPTPHAAPPVYLAAVGPAMTEVAGEVADGLLVHPFTTPRYLDEYVRPSLAKGAAAAHRRRDDVRLSVQCLVATGADDEALAAARERVRERIAFYGSTPAYRGVLETHGWGDLGDRLHAMSRERDTQRWARMAALVPDEVLAEFAVVGRLDEIGELIGRRYGGRVDRVTLPRPADVPVAAWRDVLAAVRSGA